MKEECCRGKEREMKMKLDSRKVQRLRDGTSLKANTLILIEMGLPPDVGFQEHLTQVAKWSRGPAVSPPCRVSADGPAAT